MANEPLSLQSKDHKDLLDIIDKLRSKGIGRYVDLPQIVVCGDQSSGKSSVLEAISGMSFPTKDNLCTRFAIELILRRSPTSSVKVSISPGHDRSDAEKAVLGKFDRTCNNLDIGIIVEEAGVAMGLKGSGSSFSKDILRVEISGPAQPHLTMVDLPGLFMAGSKDQSAADSSLVKSLVLDYIQRPRSIILAVVSAKNDFALQQVTELTRAVDPKGYRTLGLITKPDTLDEGSDMERFYVDLARNKDVNFRLGWHVLRNRDFAMRDATSAERDSEEARFFSKGIWATLSPSQLGVGALRPRMSNVLREQILSQLPSVIQDAQIGLKDCQLRLEKLGAARSTLPEQRRYLLRASETFSNLVTAAVNGEYTDAFFGNALTDAGFKKRLRAVVQERLSKFADGMRKNGHARQIVEGGPSFKGSISRSGYIQEVKDLMIRSRGRELPGTFNPLIVSEMFSKQCAPWKEKINNISNLVVFDAEATVNLILQHTVDEETAGALLSLVVNPAMDVIKASLQGKVIELVEPHVSGHPITYNHYLTDNIQKAHFDRQKRNLEKLMGTFLGVKTVADGEAKYHFNARALLNAIGNEIEPDMDHHACSLAIDTMQAYYKVALKKIVDDISVLAIEQCLLQKLTTIFNPEVVFDLQDNDVRRIACEGIEKANERAMVEEKMKILESAMAELNHLRKYHVVLPEAQGNDGSGNEPAVHKLSMLHDGERLSDVDGTTDLVSLGKQSLGSVNSMSPGLASDGSFVASTSTCSDASGGRFSPDTIDSETCILTTASIVGG